MTYPGCGTHQLPYPAVPRQIASQNLLGSDVGRPLLPSRISHSIANFLAFGQAVSQNICCKWFSHDDMDSLLQNDGFLKTAMNPRLCSCPMCFM